MDDIQKVLVKAGRKDLAQEYYKKTSYKTYRVSNFEELVSGLKEIGAPIELSKADKSIKVDGKLFRFPKDQKDISKSIDFDDKVMNFLRENSKLMSMWKKVNAKYSNFVKNFRSLKISDPSLLIDWGPTSPDRMNKFYKELKDAIKVIEPIIATKEGQETLRQYEILRHLFDRGYSRL